MIRLVTGITLLLASPSLVAQDDYLKVRLIGGGDAYEYKVDLGTFQTALIQTCENIRTTSCSFFSSAAESPDVLAKKQDHKDFAGSGSAFAFSHISFNSPRTHVLVADGLPRQKTYKFQVLETGSVAPKVAGALNRRIADAEWLGTKGCFALLSYESSLGLMPWHWLAILTGHPPQYDTYYLSVYDQRGALVSEAQVREDLKNSAGSMIRRRGLEANPSELKLKVPC